MTCIVAIAEAGRVHMGCDSCASDGHRRYVQVRSKITRKGGFLIGHSGSIRFADLIEHVWAPPERLEASTDSSYMCVQVATSIRTLLRDNGLMQRKDDVESASNCWAVIGYRGGLWSMEPDLQMRVDSIGYAATGSGLDYAIGALYATRAMNLEPHPRLQLALEAASHHLVSVCPPFHFELLS